MAQSTQSGNQGKAELVRDSLKGDVSQLIGTVQLAVKNAGGDLEHSSAHFVMAFSTGHYKTDPLGAQAAREVATQFVQRLTVPGDRVTARAWELNTWTTRDASALSLQVGTDRAADQARIAGLWPTTPAVGSVGGHDTERAAVELTNEFNNDAGTVLVMLTNTAASVGASGAKLLGANAPEYLDTLNHWTRVEGTQDGATLDLPYVVHSPSGDVKGQMQAVVFVPKTFTAASLSGQSRSQLLAASSAAPVAKRSGPNLLPLLIVVALAAVGFGAWRLLAGGGGGGGGRRGSLRVGDTEFAMRDLPRGRPFCVLAGSGYISESDLPVVPLTGFPPEALAELSLNGQELKIAPLGETVRLTSVGGRVPTSSAPTVRLNASDPDTELEFSGEVRGSGGVPREVQRTVRISYSQGE